MPEIPEGIVHAANNFTPSFEVTDEFGESDYQSMWEGQFDAKKGVTGMWFPRHDWMVVSSRALAHHDQQYRAVMNHRGELSPVMPWAIAHTHSGWHADIPASAGGMYQVLSREDLLDDVNAWMNGHNVSERELWPCVYTCALLDVPDSCEVRYRYQPTPNPSVEDAYAVTETFSLEAAYQELSFTPAGVPEPTVNRSKWL